MRWGSPGCSCCHDGKGPPCPMRWRQPPNWGGPGDGSHQHAVGNDPGLPSVITVGAWDTPGLFESPLLSSASGWQPGDRVIRHTADLVRSSGSRKHRQRKMNISRKRGSTFYRRFSAPGPPPTTDFRWVGAVLFHDPGSETNLFMFHSFMCLFGALVRERTGHTSCLPGMRRSSLSFSKGSLC